MSPCAVSLVSMFICLCYPSHVPVCLSLSSRPLYVVSLCASLVLPVLFCQSFVLCALCSVLLPVSSVGLCSAVFPGVSALLCFLLPCIYCVSSCLFQGRRAEMLSISTSMPQCGPLKVSSREHTRLPWSLLFFCRAFPCE